VPSFKEGNQIGDIVAHYNMTNSNTKLILVPTVEALNVSIRFGETIQDHELPRKKLDQILHNCNSLEQRFLATARSSHANSPQISASPALAQR